MSDSEDLRILVELAAHGQLSSAETEEVEQLIANKPELRSEYDRLRESSTTPAPTPARPTRSGNQSGCLLGIAGFVAALIVVSVVGIMLRPSGSDPAPTDPIAAVLDDPNNEVISLQGPTDLVGFGTLALMYSPSTHDAVLLGNDIPLGGTLVGRDGVTLATFEAGDVQELIENLDPDQDLTVVAS